MDGRNGFDKATCRRCSRCQEFRSCGCSNQEFYRRLYALEQENFEFRTTISNVQKHLMGDTEYTKILISDCNTKMKEIDEMINRLEQVTPNSRTTNQYDKCYLPISDDTVTRDETVTKNSKPKAEAGTVGLDKF